MPHYAIHYPNVVADDFDNDTVVVNLDTGTYFNLRKGASTLWELLVSGVDTEILVQTLVEHADIDASAFQTRLQQFITELADHGLITPGVGDATEFPQDRVASLSGISLDDIVLEVYSDLQDILLLDPVHDVGPDGWPRAAE